jgi:hypothetical protein
MHSTRENVVTIWVDNVGVAMTASALFIEALCPDHCNRQSPLNGFCYGGIQRPTRYIHLFRIDDRLNSVFHLTHVLSDVQFPAPLAGLVVIVEKEALEHHSEFWAYDFASTWTVIWRLIWVQKQKLPFVIAATGYKSSEFSPDDLRTLLSIGPHVPVIPGPSIYQHDCDMGCFAPQFAEKVLAILEEHIESTNS